MKDIFELIENADNYIKNNQTVDKNIINELKNKLTEQGNIGIAQINTISGDIENNSKKIAKYIKLAENIGLECVIFPELSITGCSLEDAIIRHEIIANDSLKWLDGLAKLTKRTTVIVGLACLIDGEYSSCIAMLRHGKVQNIVNKFPNNLGEYTIINDYNNTSEFLDKNRNNTKLLINCSSHTYKQYREQRQSNNYSILASKYKIPIIYVNQIGANDSLLFEGISCVYNSKGELIARTKAFEEQFIVANPIKNIGKIYTLPNGYEECIKEEENFSVDYKHDLERTYKALILGIKDYFNKCGFKRAVLGLSGGLDSTVCAVLLADAIGKENVYGVSMPSKITSCESKSDAKQLADNLGINFIEAPIRSIVDTISTDFKNMFEKMEKNWQFRYRESFTHDNIQARTRATILWGISNEFESCIPIATSDKSEAYMGYATINGDMSGGYAPIADITKTKLFALARWLNKNREEKNAIPESIILKRPGAELAIDPKTGKPLIAEDALMPYKFLDEIIWRIENRKESYEQMLQDKFLYETNNKINKEQKIEWLNKFYKRMSTAFYKWSIAAPSVIVEQHSINKGDYRQPITSSHINYKGVSKEYISENLK